MKTHHKITGKMSQAIKTQALVLCYLLAFFSCTKEKEKTDHDYPRVTTGLVTNINTEGATFNGSFLHAGKSEIIDHGFIFDTSAQPTIQRGEKISLGTSNGSGSFTATVNFGMKIGRKYHVSAYAQNKEKIFYAETVSFISMGSVPPEIIAVVPSEGVRGDTVVIKGKYFTYQLLINTVKFGNENAYIIAASDTALTVRVPTSNSMEHVDVFVTVAEQTAQKINGFRFLAPVITDLSPSQGVIGDTVTIRGQHFERMKEHNIVKFRNNQASIIYASDTVLTVKVPSSDGEEHVDVFVTASGITTHKNKGFQYLKPVITDFSPAQGIIGDTLTITGQYFYPDMEIRFNQVRARIYQSDHSSARVIVPACQSTSANISVTVDGLTGIAEQKFIYAKAEVAGLSADYGVIGDTILIYGKNFGYHKDAVSVFFGELPVTVWDVDNLSIKVVVPASGGKTSLPVTVRVDGQLGEGNQMFGYLAPVIERFEPATGKAGDVVIIKGQNFSKIRGQNILTVGRVKFNVTEAATNQLKVVISDTTYNLTSSMNLKIDGRETFSMSTFEINSSPWTKRNDLPTALAAIGFTVSGNAYITGGADVSLWHYLTNEDQWIQKTDANYPLKSETVGFEIDGIYYFLDRNIFWQIYDPIKDSWTTEQLLLLSGVPFTSAFVIDNVCYVIIPQGGTINLPESYGTWICKPADDNWKRLNSIGYYSGINFSFVINNVGYTGIGKAILEYMPETNSWENVTSMPSEIVNPSVLVARNKSYFISSNLSAIWEYNPDGNQWRRVSYYPDGNPDVSFTFVVDDKIYIGSGRTLWEFDPSKL